ncbi:MAG: ABC transporter [Desulfurococcales archaeon ex4484_58]|nr:MAG: ABC transporter [Desulfurococcales archaeon ex4484_58]
MENKVLAANIKEAGYDNKPIIKNISFDLSPGEILVVTGRSGSGKTTLLRSITGLIYVKQGFFHGEIRILDKTYKKPDPLEILSITSYIPQEPWYSIVGYSVRSEYCHAASIKGLKCELSKLENYGLQGLVDHITYGLSSGQIQRLLWAETIEIRNPLLLMDEPYTYIDLQGRGVFKKYIEKYIGENGSIVIVDHIPGNWSEFEPKMLILENGNQKYYGKYIEVDTPKTSFLREKTGSDEKLLEAHDLWYKYPGYQMILKGVDIEVKRGEVIGLIGKNGSGKTTLLKLLAGIYKPVRGEIERYGSIIYVPENPLLYFTYPTPREELYSSNNNVKLVEDVIDRFNLWSVLDKPLAKLSSGERRRVAIASSFLRNYDIYLLDEPTGGLDYYNLIEIIESINHLRRNKCGVIISHHDPRLRGLFDRECILENGVLKCN